MILNIPTARVFAPLLEPARYKGAFGGRTSGKSHFFAGMAVEELVADPDLPFVCIREIQKSLQYSSKRLIESKIQSFGVGHLFDIQKDVILRRGGSGLIIFTGMQDHTAESIKSLEGFKRGWVEEAQKLSARSLQMLRPTIMRVPEAQLWFSWNPEQPEDAVDALMRAPKVPDGTVVVQANYRDNPFLDDNSRLELEYDRRYSPDSFDHVWNGGYNKRSKAQIFSGKWRVEEFEPGEDWEGPYHGLDFGFSADPTAGVRVWIYDRKIWVEHEAFKVGLELDDTTTPDGEFVPGTATFLKERIPGIAEYVVRADNARPESISYLRRHGLPRCEPVLKGKGSVEDGIEFIKSFERVIIHPRCEHVTTEARLYSFKIDKASGDILPSIADEHNHGWDACIEYGQMVQTHGGPIEVQDVKAGDMVATRQGYKMVRAARLVQADAPIYELETAGGRKLRATADHLVYAGEKGFVRMDALRYYDEVTIHRGVSSCRESEPRSSHTPVSSGVDIQNQIAEQTGSTFGVQRRAPSISPFTDRCGSIVSGRSLKGTIFTTLTGTVRTTIRAISSVFPPRIIPQSMKCGAAGLTTINGTLTGFGRSRKHGTQALKGWPRTEESVRFPMLDSCLLKNYADIVAWFFLRGSPDTRTRTAPMRASRPPEENRGSMMSIIPVDGAVSRFPRTSTSKESVALDRVLIVRDTGTRNKVYDLSVEGAEEFFASGILVHNCRYALEPMMKDKDHMARFIAMAES